jgi:hypothetical protein
VISITRSIVLTWRRRQTRHVVCDRGGLGPGSQQGRGHGPANGWSMVTRAASIYLRVRGRNQCGCPLSDDVKVVVLDEPAASQKTRPLRAAALRYDPRMIHGERFGPGSSLASVPTKSPGNGIGRRDLGR